MTSQPPAPPGFTWVYHRLTTEAEYMISGVPTRFGPGEYRLLSTPIAEWLCENVKKRETPAYADDPDPEVRLRAVDYAFAMDGTRFYGEPLDLTGQVEYLQLGKHDMYLQRGTDGVKTERKVIPVRGSDGTMEAISSPTFQSDHGTEILLNRIADLERRLNEQPASRGRRRPRTRLAPKAPRVESESNAPA